MKKSLLAALLILLIPVAIFAGGGKEVEVTEQVEPQFEGLTEVTFGEWEIGKKGGTFVLPSLSDPKSFNIITGSETSTTDIVNRLYDGLLDRDQHTLEWAPEMAESWEISEDQTTITFTLRKGLVWSDGEPLTAHDFVLTSDIVLNDEVESNMTSSQYVGDTAAVWEALDDLTVRVTLPEVYAGIYQLCSLPPTPSHIFEPIIESEGYAAINSFWGVDADVTSVVGCGPFVLSDYVPGQKVVLVPNENYWKKDAKGNQLPYLNEVIFQTVPDQDTQLEKFLAGELDFYGVRGEDYAVTVDQKEAVGFELYNVGPATSTQFITFNQNPIEGDDDAGIEPPQLTWLSNDKFRLAMAHLIDRETIINNIAYGFGYPQYSFIPRFSPFYWEGVDDAAPAYDPEAAKALLDEIGYKDTDGDGFREDTDGNKISLVLNTNAGNKVREAIGSLFAQEAQKIGIDITFKPEDFNNMVTKLLSGNEWQMILIGLTGSLDPISGANVYPSDGNLHMIEPNQESPRREWEAEVDEAWDYAALTTDEQQRKEGYETIQKLWVENLPWVYTFNAAIMHGYDANLGNVKPRPIQGYAWDGIIEYLYFK